MQFWANFFFPFVRFAFTIDSIFLFLEKRKIFLIMDTLPKINTLTSETLPLPSLNVFLHTIPPNFPNQEGQMQHFLELQTFFRKKRNRNACNEHKRKHQKCPLDCPGRKSKKKKSKTSRKTKKGVSKKPEKPTKKIKFPASTSSSKLQHKIDLPSSFKEQLSPIEFPSLGSPSSKLPHHPITEVNYSDASQALFNVVPHAPSMQPYTSKLPSSSPQLHFKPIETIPTFTSTTSDNSPHESKFNDMVSRFFDYHSKVSSRRYF